VASGASVVIEPVRPVRDQAASGYKSTIRVHCRKLIPGRQCNYLLAVNEGRGAYYSRISVARERAECGTVTPIPLAVLRLITSSYLVGVCTGRSAGFSPLRMRST